nr:ATP synthase F0 subunit 8 [Glomeridesmus spelaeus]QCF39613.1 ATP synthase F0 subunit 8 [Glomeridesmus spelaeus]QCF39626.1 ATP synthase F0 subunit 8 [Glomeridesmus spelaeus]QCF39639.1 ATP synthase F0 subunit 8 [Glomeridesmus spelaeus]
MPQMAPMNWEMMFLISIFTLLMISIIIHQTFNTQLPKMNNKNFKNLLNWKW